MLYDLNIAWSPGTPSSEIESTLRFAKHLGYDVVALNHTISGPSIPTNPNPITNPIPPQLSSAPGTSTAPSSQRPPSSLPTVLRRATLLITDPSTTNYRLADHSRSYDLLALRPTSEKSFAWACSSATEPPALISLDMTASLGFHIHHRTAMAAVARGSRFEICYSQALAAGTGGAEASRHRANFIGNVQGLVRATKGRGLVLSSEAQSALGLRGPADVVNLMAVWGLGPERGMEALGTTPRSVVVNEGVRRRGFRGVVDIVKPAEGGDEVLRREKEENGNGKKDEQKQQQGQKRKNGAGGGGGGGVGGQNSGGPGGDGGMSKRQAKKLRKEGPAGV
ncbi:RNase P subunit p30-domain-containing protein [Cladorrhinum samala]|uniref:RNase P subunit p30-domain-containing protein n=1 Tax=Cladorrhinum samala TaxID=585594 RepID=A0AAV9H7Y8_9PEZI|nr:RNase P subunit p30-domain-containing protein [Cladorrhinum samala]